MNSDRSSRNFDFVAIVVRPMLFSYLRMLGIIVVAVILWFAARLVAKATGATTHLYWGRVFLVIFPILAALVYMMARSERVKRWAAHAVLAGAVMLAYVLGFPTIAFILLVFVILIVHPYRASKLRSW